MTKILNLPVPPSINSYWKPHRGGGIYKTQEAKRYSQGIANRLYAEGMRPLVGDVRVDIDWFRVPARKGPRDIDNILKCLLDALEGIAYRNDSQVTQIRATKHPPRGPTSFIELTISPSKRPTTEALPTP